MSTRSVRSEIRKALKPAAGETAPGITHEEAQKILETAKASASRRDQVTEGEAKLLAGLAGSSFEGAAALSVAPEAREELETFFEKHHLPFGANEAKLRARVGQLLEGAELSRPLAEAPETRQLHPLFLDDQRRCDGPLREAFVDSAKGQFFLKSTPAPGMGSNQPQVRWHGPFTLRASESVRDLAIDRLRSTLATATDGLLFQSESDYPFDFFLAQGAGAASPTAGQFGELLGAPGGASVETRDFAQFFDRLTLAQDWWDEGRRADAVKYAALRSALERELTELQIFQVGEIEVGLYLVGRNAYGDLVGVSTVSIET